MDGVVIRPLIALLSRHVADQGVSVEEAIAFGAQGLKLDVFHPHNGVAREKIVLFVHGGSWIVGDRREYFFVGAALAAQGYVTILADYRKFPKVRFPAFVEDAAAAYRWAAIRFGAARPIVVMGHSAGAHIAALLALDKRYLAGFAPPAGLIGLAGPYAIDRVTNFLAQPIFAGAKGLDIRPASFAHPGAPPALLLHGAKDPIVRPANSVQLVQALRAKGSAAEVWIEPQLEHLGILLALAKPLRGRAGVYGRVMGFLAG